MRTNKYKYAILLMHKESGLYVKRGHVKDIIKNVFEREKTPAEKAIVSSWNSHMFEIILKDKNEISKYLTKDKKKAQYWINSGYYCTSLENVIKDADDINYYLVKYVKTLIKTTNHIRYDNIVHNFGVDYCEVDESGYIPQKEKKYVVKFWKNSKVMPISVSSDNGGRCRICGVSCAHIPHVTVSGKDVCYCCLKNVSDKLNTIVDQMNPEWKSEVEAEMFARHLGG